MVAEPIISRCGYWIGANFIQHLIYNGWSYVKNTSSPIFSPLTTTHTVARAWRRIVGLCCDTMSGSEIGSSTAFGGNQHKDDIMMKVASVTICFMVLSSCAFAQQAAYVWSSHFICPQRPGIGVTTIVSDESKVLCLGCDLGAMVSTNNGLSFQANMLPSDAADIEYSPTVGWICNNTFLVAGADQSLTNKGVVFSSNDGGRTWSKYPRTRLLDAVFPGVKGADNWLLYGDGNAKVFNYFSTNCGESWLSIPPPDSLYKPSNLSYEYLKDGLFVVKSVSPNRWYTIDFETQEYRANDYPSIVRNIYRLSDNSLLGVTQGGSPHTFYRQENSAATFESIAYTSQDGSTIDSAWVRNVRQMPSGALVMTASYSEDELLVVDGTNSMTVHKDSIAINSRLWNDVSAVSGNRCLVPLQKNDNSAELVLINATSLSYKVIPYHGVSTRPKILLDRYAVDFAGGGRVLVLDTESGDIIIGGQIKDAFNRNKSIAIDKIVRSDSAMFVLDRLGDISLKRDDSTFVLVARRNNELTRAPATNDLALDKAMSFGLGFIWADSSNIYAGGTQLLRFNYAGHKDTIRRDTTTFWTIGLSGRRYTGFRRPVVQYTGTGAFQDLGAIGENRATISDLVEVSTDTLIAGLRGYHVEVDGEVTDSISGGIWLSADQGQSWMKSIMPVAGSYVHSLVRRVTDGSLWASVTRATLSVQGTDYKQPYADDLSLLRSNDGGFTWTLVSTVPYAGPWILSDCNISFHGNRTIAWTARDRVLWSDSDGENWNIVEGLPNAPNSIANSMFSSDGNLHISTSDGYYRVPSPVLGIDDKLLDDPRGIATPYFGASIHPNPSGSSATLRLYNTNCISSATMTFEIIDLLGNTMLDLKPYVATVRQAGIVDVPIDLGAVRDGVYFVIGVMPGGRNFIWPMVIRR